MCPRSAEQFEHLKGERRRELLKAARKVFARKGLAAAKIGDVAAQAGISYGLVYHYFPEKESLFAAVVEESVAGWETLVATAREQPGSPWDRLSYLCSQMISGVQEEPDYVLVMVRAFTEDAAPPPVRASLERYRTQIYEQLTAMIEEGQRAGEVAPGAPSDLARVLMAVVQGLAINRVTSAGDPAPSLDVVLRLLRGAAPRAAQ